MKRSAPSLILVILAFSLAAWCQNNSSNAYKTTLDRLESLSHRPEAEWRFHDDIPHPEDPSVNDADWGTWTVKNVSGPGGQNANEDHWKGTRVFRRWIQIPDKINGYATQGSKVWADLRFGTPGSLMITVFSNGGILYRGDDDNILPVLISENAQPGQKYLVAIRVVTGDDVQSEFFHSELTIEPPNARPDPGLLRLEMLSATPIIAAYADGRGDREAQLRDAVNSIDFSPLDRGD